MRNFNVSFKSKNINSKLLFNDINAVLQEAGEEFIVTKNSTFMVREFDYTQLAGFTEALLEELEERGKIRVYEVICDERNNLNADVRKGVIKLQVTYKQTNCLNFTEINYIFTTTKR